MHLLVGAVGDAWEAVLELESRISDEAWTTGTALPGWSVGDIYAHLGHLEGAMYHGFSQPDPPSGWNHEGSPLDRLTNGGVLARRRWPRARVMDEVRRAAAATLAWIEGVPENQWNQEVATPVGSAPLNTSMELRVGDVYVHLLDLADAANIDPEDVRRPGPEAVIVERTVRLTGWAMGKQARLPDGTRIRLDLIGPGAAAVDMVMVQGRGIPASPDGSPVDGSVRGLGIGYTLRAGGRTHPASLAGAVSIEGEAAERMVSRFRLFG